MRLPKDSDRQLSPNVRADNPVVRQIITPSPSAPARGRASRPAWGLITAAAGRIVSAARDDNAFLLPLPETL